MGWISWLCPGMNLKRWLLLFTVGVLCCALGLALFFNYQFMGYVEELMFRMAYLTTGKYSNTVSMLGGFLFLCIGGFVMIYAKEEDLLEMLLPQYVAEGKSQLVISVGCTGGQHRSVYIANKLAAFLRRQGYKVLLSHRDLRLKNR